MVLLREQPMPIPPCPYFRSDGSDRAVQHESIGKKLAFIDSRVAAGQSIGDGYAPLALCDWEEPCSQEVIEWLMPPANRAAWFLEVMQQWAAL